MLPAGPGRRFAQDRVVRSGDVLPSGQARLDALARYLQDVANDDGIDAAIDPDLAWVVRRTTMQLVHRPRYRQELGLVTWASAAGSRWAERRTTIRVGDRVAVEAAALWVCVDRATFRPARLSERFWEMYGAATDGHSVSSRLLHDGPPTGVGPGRAWPLRLADFDVFDHVNNAATWVAVEDELARVAPAGRDDRAAADGKRSRAVRAHAELHLVGIAMHDRHLADRNAEPLRDQLCECRLVALAVAMRTGENLDRADRIDANLCELPQADASYETAHRFRRSNPTGLDEQETPMPRSLPSDFAFALRAPKPA